MKKYLFWICVALSCLYLSGLSTNYDFDFWARIIVGERFIEHGILPFQDFLSYTPTHDWYDHEWGSGVVFYLILKYFKAFGIIAFQAIMMFLTTFFVFKTKDLQKHSYPNSIIAVLLFVLFFYSLNIDIVRCQLFSFFFFSVFLYVLEKKRLQNSLLIYLIPILTIIWNNVHGGIVAGLGLVGLYLIGAIIEKKSVRDYLAVLAVSSQLLVINPYGIKYLNFLFSAATMTRKFIIEWWNVFHPAHFLYKLPLCIYLLFGSGLKIFSNIKNKNYEYTKLIVITATIIEGFIHVKLLSFALITVTAFCYNDMFKILIKAKRILQHIEKSLYIVILIFAITIPMYSPLIPRCDYTRYPLREVEFLKINNIKGNIIPSFGLGSFVSYKLYPNNLIYMDGRYEEVYNSREFLALGNYELVVKNWKDVINHYDTDILMPLKTVKVYNQLLKEKDWVQIFEGDICGIFVKRDSLTGKESYKMPTEDIMYYRKTLFDSYFKNY